MAQVKCPVLFLLGNQDQMTTPKAAQSLVKAASSAHVRHATVVVPVGHHQMTEAPEETLLALGNFLHSN